MKNILTRISRLNVMSHNQPPWVAEEPSKTGRPAVQGFGATRQNGAFCLNLQVDNPMLSDYTPVTRHISVASNYRYATSETHSQACE